MWNPAGIINHILPLRCSETLHPPAENTALSVIWTLTQKSCSVLTERGGESRQLVVGVTVQRKGPRCDGTDETLVCCAPVRPAHPSHAAAGRGKCERDVNWTMPALYEVEVGGGEEEEGRWTESLLIHRSEVDERRAAGGCPLELRRHPEFQRRLNTSAKGWIQCWVLHESIWVGTGARMT